MDVFLLSLYWVRATQTPASYLHLHLEPGLLPSQGCLSAALKPVLSGLLITHEQQHGF